MGIDIKPIKTKSYEWKQPPKEYLPRCPFRMIISGPSGTGKGVLTQNLLLSDQCYKGCFERIYYCSGSAHLDHNLRAIADYAERELKQDPERDPCLLEGWDVERLSAIISRQRGAVAKAKRMGHKTLPQIMIVVDDLADNKRVVRGDLLSNIFIRGRHFGCNCIVLTQRYRLLDQNLRTNANALIFFRARNGKDVEALVEENSALADKDTLHQLYDYATRDKLSFLYIDLMQTDVQKAFYKKFDSQLVVE